MANDKQPMQAGGAKGKAQDADPTREPPSEESQGGAYPNPHAHKDGKAHARDKFMGHGGQTEQAYHGAGQLGERKTGEQPNAGSRED